MTRPAPRQTDADLRRTRIELARLGPKAANVLALIDEVLEARERGITGTVDELTTNRIPTNMKDGTYAPVPDGGLTVCAWTPEEDGRGKATQVHLTFDLTHLVPGFHAVTRFKSAQGIDRLIRVLHEYRCEVWPSFKGIALREGRDR